MNVKRTKVVILSSVHSALDTRIFYKEAVTLASSGFDVILIAQHTHDETIDNIKIIALPKPKNRLIRIFGTWHIINIARQQHSDIYHFHDPELIPAAVLLKIVTRSMIIYDVHEDYSRAILTRNWLPRILRKTASVIINLIEKSFSRNFDVIIAATEDIAANFKNRNIQVIHNYPLLDTILPLDKNTTRRNGLIYAGALSRPRGIIELVQAMPYVNPAYNAKLILCGEFVPDSFKEEVKSLSGFKMVEYLGWLKPQEAWALMAQTIAGCVCFQPSPNHINALPNKLFEYMAAGIPVICSNFPGWKYIIDSNKCGIAIDPLNSREIAYAIDRLLSNPEEARQMGENGRKAVIEKYNWNSEGTKLISIYRELLNNK